jgi:hypothetical protein
MVLLFIPMPIAPNLSTSVLITKIKGHTMGSGTLIRVPVRKGTIYGDVPLEARIRL